jgi:hypothetical protein
MTVAAVADPAARQFLWSADPVFRASGHSTRKASEFEKRR